MRTEQVELAAAVRAAVGKIAARRLRAQGLIPAVLYGREAASVAVAVDAAEFSHALPPAAWYSTVINLKVEGGNGGQAEPTPVMIADIQRDIVGRRVVSIDFKRISLKEKIHTHVSLRHTGESPGVKLGGIVDQIVHDLMVECLPTEMPDHVEVDISGLQIGDAARVQDITLPPGVTALAPPEEAVIVIAPPVRLEEVAPAAAEEGALVGEVEEPEVVGEEESE